MTNAIAIFARRHSITVEQAVALPAIFDRAAKEVGMTPQQLVSMATYSNQALADYIKQLAQEVIEKM